MYVDDDDGDGDGFLITRIPCDTQNKKIQIKTKSHAHTFMEERKQNKK